MHAAVHEGSSQGIVLTFDQRRLQRTWQNLRPVCSHPSIVAYSAGEIAILIAGHRTHLEPVYACVNNAPVI
jgi:hypothetical protein